MQVEEMLIIGSMLLFVSIASSKVSSRLGIPTLLFFLFIGILVGQYSHAIPMKSTGIWHAVTKDTAQTLGIITLILVLFAGGLETDFQHIRPILWSGILLSTLGALITTLVVGIFLQWSTAGTLNISLLEGLVVGAIVASTDAAAVFSIMRARNIQLKANLGQLLELESGSNDVMVFFLMSFFLKKLKNPSYSFFQVIPTFFQEMIIGAIGGIAMGYLMVYMINRINLSYPGLYPALTLSLLFMTHAITNKMHGSGFLAVYICGMILGNHDLIHKKSLIQFYKGIGWLMQIVMFIALGLLAIPSELSAIVPLGIKLSLILMLVARPLSVFLGLSFSSLKIRHKTFVSWIGLRGAVPIVFATYLYPYQLQSSPDASQYTLFHLIFFVVIISILLQGTTLYPFAKWLKLENKVVTARKEKQIQQRSDTVKKMLIQLEVPPDSPAHDKAIVEIGFPENVYIPIIHRAKQYLQPRGDTKIEAGDRLMVMYDTKKDLKELKGRSVDVR